MTVIDPPPPVILDRPGTVRWAVGNHEGPRSSTWRVEGVSNKRGRDDFYVGTRQTMKAVKVSLHDADRERGCPPATIFAFTKEFTVANGLAERWSLNLGQTTEVAPGWRHELTVATPTTTFGVFNEAPPLRRAESIQWWVAPPHPWQLCFHFYVGEPGCCAVTLDFHVGEVCRMPLANGRCLWVVAQCEPMADTVGEAIRERVARLPPEPNHVYPFTLLKNDGGVPVLLDLAVASRPRPSREVYRTQAGRIQTADSSPADLR